MVCKTFEETIFSKEKSVTFIDSEMNFYFGSEVGNKGEAIKFNKMEAIDLIEFMQRQLKEGGYIK